MEKITSPLDQLTVATPCPANWKEMTGDDRVRFCSQCQLHVYNLSGMTRIEAETLLREKEGRLCIRFYQRADGTVLTQDCPVGIKILRQKRVRGMGIGIAAAITLITITGTFTTSSIAEEVRGERAITGEAPLIKPQPNYTTGQPVMMGKPMMGDWADPNPPIVKPPKVEDPKQPDPKNPDQGVKPCPKKKKGLFKQKNPE